MTKTEMTSKGPRVTPWRELTKQENFESTCDFTFPSAYHLWDKFRAADGRQIHNSAIAGNEPVLDDIVTLEELTGSTHHKAGRYWEGQKFARLAATESHCGSWSFTLAVPIGLSLYAPPVQTRLALFVSYLNPSEDSEEEETYISVIEAKLRADAQFGQDAEGVPMDFLRKHDEGFSITQSSEVGREFDGTCRLHCGTGNTGDFALISAVSLGNAVFRAPEPSRLLPFILRLSLSTFRTTTRRFPLSRLSQLPLHHLSSHLDLLSLQRLSQSVPLTSPLRRSLSTIPSIRMRASLSPYFSDPKGFARALNLAGGVVGGSTVLSVLMPQAEWDPSDLDLVIPWVGHTSLERFLVQDGWGLDEEKAGRQGYQFGPGICFTYLPYKKKERRIDVCRLRHGASPVDFILTYHSTACMNYFDGLSIVCLFPNLTFSKVLLKNNAATTVGNHAVGVGKYIDRGYFPLKEEEDLQSYLKVKGVGEEKVQPTWRDLRKTWRAGISF